MIVTIVSASELKGRKKARRIISGYLPQIGKDVWSGRISKEGLGSLRNQLAEAATTQMSVLCWHHQGRHSPVVAWKIGNMKHFDHDGHYVFSQHRVTNPLKEHVTAELQQLSRLTRLAALTHDLGKATAGFDKKLRVSEGKKQSKGIPDPVRHELISLLILLPLASKIKAEKTWSVFSSPAEVTSFFESEVRESLLSKTDGYKAILNESAQDQVDSYKHISGSSIEGFNLSHLESDPLLTGWLWLVLTHHKLPENKVRDWKDNNSFGANRSRKKNDKISRLRTKEGMSDISIQTTLLRYVNTTPDTECEPFFNLSHAEHGTPWKDPSWIDSLLSLLAEMDENPYIFDPVSLNKGNPFVTGMMHFCRPAVVMADHLASIQKVVAEQVDDGCYANTAQEDGVIKMADPLHAHLNKTESWSERIFHQLFCEQGGPMAPPRIPQSDTQQLLSNDSPGAFQWQNRLAELGSQVDPSGGFLALVVAGTGSGKTRGCIKLLNECSGDQGLRASLALGLRSLADQGYRDYTQFPISLPKHSVGRLIGAHYPVEPEETSLGTSASEWEGDFLLNDAGHLFEGNAFINMVAEGPSSSLLPKPVTALTIDNLIDVISLHRSKASYLTFHMLHTDLIIDEIDNLSPEDLIFVEILVYLAGLYGRKCIIASATLNPIIAQAMGEAYKAGFKEHQVLYGKKPGTMAVVSNEAPFYVHESLDTNPRGEKLLSALANQWEEKENLRHRTGILSFNEEVSNIDNLFSRIRESVIQLGANHSVYDPLEMEVSQGFVRFSRVNEAQAFALYLAEQAGNEDTYIEVICYHAKTTGFERYFQEYHLNHLMKRDDNGLPKNCPKDVLAGRAAFIDRAKSAGAKRAILVVSTTSIIEVGRDHDYDWCILEPSSLASFLQSIGRVLRHRKEAVVEKTAPNILVLESPVSLLRAKSSLWAFPGIESPSPLTGRFEKVPSYRLTSTGAPNLSGRLDKLGVAHSEASDEQVKFAADMLGQSVSNPSNHIMASKPARYEDFPEYSLTLIKMADHLCAGHNPLNESNHAGINAGNVLNSDKYRLEHKIGRALKFRGDDDSGALLCYSTDGDYDRNWKSARYDDRGGLIPDNAYVMSKIHITGIKCFYFENMRSSRMAILDQYRSRFGNLDEEVFCTLFFQIGLRAYEVEDENRACRFHWLLGVANHGTGSN